MTGRPDVGEADVVRLLLHLDGREVALLGAADASAADDRAAAAGTARPDGLAVLRSQRAALLTCQEILRRRRVRPEVQAYARWLVRQVADDLATTG